MYCDGDKRGVKMETKDNTKNGRNQKRKGRSVLERKFFVTEILSPNMMVWEI